MNRKKSDSDSDDDDDYNGNNLNLEKMSVIVEKLLLSRESVRA